MISRLFKPDLVLHTSLVQPIKEITGDTSTLEARGVLDKLRESD
jgi:hypothetical protein